eukprot:scaffold250_cov121-Skeletonema_dohrnii-CCMP3373.AAC.3
MSMCHPLRQELRQIRAPAAGARSSLEMARAQTKQLSDEHKRITKHGGVVQYVAETDAIVEPPPQPLLED